MTFTFYTDPGHGWLEVPKQLLKELGIAGKISGYSYEKGQMAYLEEDVDAGLFAKEYERVHGKPSIREKHQENTPIRNYPSYRKSSRIILMRDVKAGVTLDVMSRQKKLEGDLEEAKDMLAEAKADNRGYFSPIDIAAFEKDVKVCEGRLRRHLNKN